MRASAKVAAAITTALALAHPAQGQFLDYGTHCLAGSFLVCASVSIGWIPVLDGEATQIHIRLSNRQGAPGFEYDGNWGIPALTISNLEHDSRCNFFGAVYCYTGLEGFWEGNAGGYPDGFVEGDPNTGLRVELDPGIHYPLFGCNPAPHFFEDSYTGPVPVYTCGNGWLFWQFVLHGTFSITNDTEIGLNFADYTDSPFGTSHVMCRGRHMRSRRS